MAPGESELLYYKSVSVDIDSNSTKMPSLSYLLVRQCAAPEEGDVLIQSLNV